MKDPARSHCSQSSGTPRIRLAGCSLSSAATAVGGVVYTITAVRGALRGGDATVLLKFGTSTGSGALGVTIASPAESGGGGGVKLAA